MGNRKVEPRYSKVSLLSTSPLKLVYCKSFVPLMVDGRIRRVHISWQLVWHGHMIWTGTPPVQVACQMASRLLIVRLNIKEVVTYVYHLIIVHSSTDSVSFVGFCAAVPGSPDGSYTGYWVATIVVLARGVWRC